MDLEEQFLQYYEDIHRKLKQIHNSPEGKFLELIKQSKNSIIHAYLKDLEEIHDIRNFLIHPNWTSRGKLITVLEDGVIIIKKIRNFLVNPPKVMPLFSRNKVLRFDYNEKIGICVQSMYENDYSQAPIYNNGNFYGLLTTNTIARWLGSWVKDGFCDLNIEIGYIYDKFTEEEEKNTNCCFLKRTSSIIVALEKFRNYENEGKRLYAILITEKGITSEEPLGIITSWDLPKIIDKI